MKSILTLLAILALIVVSSVRADEELSAKTSQQSAANSQINIGSKFDEALLAAKRGDISVIEQLGFDFQKGQNGSEQNLQYAYLCLYIANRLKPAATPLAETTSIRTSINEIGTEIPFQQKMDAEKQARKSMGIAGLANNSLGAIKGNGTKDDAAQSQATLDAIMGHGKNLNAEKRLTLAPVTIATQPEEPQNTDDPSLTYKVADHEKTVIPESLVAPTTHGGFWVQEGSNFGIKNIQTGLLIGAWQDGTDPTSENVAANKGWIFVLPHHKARILYASYLYTFGSQSPSEAMLVKHSSQAKTDMRVVDGSWSISRDPRYFHIETTESIDPQFFSKDGGNWAVDVENETQQVEKTDDDIYATIDVGLTARTPGQNSTAAPVQAFENSLGMKFVPVPGTSVLFSIWVTRQQDYALYAKAKGIDWQPPESTGPNYPVVSRFESAVDFFKWLTEKERAEGKIAKDQSYRLPTDDEWSVAVGLAEPDIAKNPAQKNSIIKDQYPWGNQWPPPQQAGNYKDDTEPGGYQDGYRGAAPVGTFTPNKFGLYDMGGNVEEWIGDTWLRGVVKSTEENNFYRGGSFQTPVKPSNLLSSKRFQDFGAPWDDTGFRLVFVPFAEARTFSVHINSEPNVLVFLDDAFMGVTPDAPTEFLAIPRVAPGLHRFKFIKDGFEPIRAKVLVDLALMVLSEETIQATGGDRDHEDYFTFQVQPFKMLKTLTQQTSLKPAIEGGNLQISDLGLNMTWIKPGTFTMGGRLREGGTDLLHLEEPTTNVTLTHGFWLSQTPITAEQWHDLMDPSGKTVGDADRKMPQRANWTAAISFCEKLTERERLAGRLPAGAVYTLPTEAQWQFACVAGKPSVGTEQGGGDDSCAHEVGTKPPNGWGFYDMLGNISEWTADYVGPYHGGTIADPGGATSGACRVARGGGYGGTPSDAYFRQVTTEPGFAICEFRVALSWPDAVLIASP